MTIPDGRTTAIDFTEIDKVTDAHYRRLRRIERMYDTGQIGEGEFQRRERDEDRRYEQELAAVR